MELEEEISIDLDIILNSYNANETNKKNLIFNKLKTKTKLFIKDMMLSEESIDISKFIETPKKLKLTQKRNFKIQ